jgi:hypothetical protein
VFEKDCVSYIGGTQRHNGRLRLRVRLHDERYAARKRKKLKSQEPAGGSMAVEGTEPDATHSCGQLSEQGKEAWRKGTGIDGGGKSS